MVDPLRESRDKADCPESRAPSGLARKVPICIVALLGFVGTATTFVARLASEQLCGPTRLTKD
jgi:hypothetical protein